MRCGVADQNRFRQNSDSDWSLDATDDVTREWSLSPEFYSANLFNFIPNWIPSRLSRRHSRILFLQTTFHIRIMLRPYTAHTSAYASIDALNVRFCCVTSRRFIHTHNASRVCVCDCECLTGRTWYSHPFAWIFQRIQHLWAISQQLQSAKPNGDNCLWCLSLRPPLSFLLSSFIQLRGFWWIFCFSVFGRQYSSVQTQITINTQTRDGFPLVSLSHLEPGGLPLCASVPVTSVFSSILAVKNTFSHLHLHVACAMGNGT